jgi:HEAT repeat protein
LARSIEKDERLLSQLVEILETGSDVEKGTCADIMKHVSKDRPEILVGYVDELVEYIDYKAPRVKWGVQESIGNIAQRFPKEVEKAIPRLLANTKDESTVVRWCAAFALSEMVKNNPKARNELLPRIEGLVKNEKNNGVKNVYLKALETINK